MGNPAAGVLVLLLALWLLLAFVSGRLEWLFRLREVAATDASGADEPSPPLRPSTVFAR